MRIEGSFVRAFTLIELLVVVAIIVILMGDQHCGGIASGKNNLGSFPSCSRIQTALSKPARMLAAEFVARYDATPSSWTMGVNGPLAGTGWDVVPAHKSAAELPVGSNEILIRGSGGRCQSKDMRIIRMWGTSRELYSYQNDFRALEAKSASLVHAS